MGYIVKYFQLPYKEKLLLIKATFFLIVIKGMVVLFPLRWYKSILGIQNTRSEFVPDSLALKLILYVSRAIVRARKIIPWESQCLTEAITAKILLRKGGVGSTLFLGINRDGADMTAHAWLCCGDKFVTGKRGMEKYTIVSTFS